MKKLFILALFALAFSSNLFAAADPEVNNRSVEHLESTYSDATGVFWTAGDEFDKASFSKGGTRIDVFYDADGDLVGTFKTFAFDKLPKAAINVLTTQYTFPKYQLTDCIEFTDAAGNKFYYVSLATKNDHLVLEITLSGSVSRVTAAK